MVDTKRLRVLRVKGRLTQIDISILMGVSKWHYACIERGQRSASPEDIQKIGRILGAGKEEFCKKTQG